MSTKQDKPSSVSKKRNSPYSSSSSSETSPTSVVAVKTLRYSLTSETTISNTSSPEKSQQCDFSQSGITTPSSRHISSEEADGESANMTPRPEIEAPRVELEVEPAPDISPKFVTPLQNILTRTIFEISSPMCPVSESQTCSPKEVENKPEVIDNRFKSYSELGISSESLSSPEKGSLSDVCHLCSIATKVALYNAKKENMTDAEIAELMKKPLPGVFCSVYPPVAESWRHRLRPRPLKSLKRPRFYRGCRSFDPDRWNRPNENPESNNNASAVPPHGEHGNSSLVKFDSSE